MTDLRRFSTTYLQSGRRKVLVPYCEHDNSDAVLNQCVDDKTLLPTDSICLVNVVTPGLLSQLTAYNLMQGASPVSTAMDFTCTAQPNPHREFMVARAEDMLENVAQRLRNKDVSFRSNYEYCKKKTHLLMSAIVQLNVRTVVLEGEPRSAIMNLAHEFKPDIIICTTGKAGRIKK